MKVYGGGTGVMMGILTLIPLLGFIILLIANSRATAVLRDNGLKVGLIGVNLADARRRLGIRA